MVTGSESGDSLVITAMGVRVSVQVAGSHAALLRESIARSWSRCLLLPATSTDTAPVDLRVVLDDDPAIVAAAHAAGDLGGTDLAQIMESLSPRITLTAIEEHAGSMLMLHAAAIADPDTGAAMAFVGPSGAGKTTATRVLAQTWGYVTDETVVVREDNTLVAYPKPLSVIVDGEAHKVQMSVDELGLAEAPAECRLERVFLLVRDGSVTPRLERVAEVQALAQLAPETSFLSRLPRPLHRLIEACGPDGLHSLHYAEAADLPAVVENASEELR